MSKVTPNKPPCNWSFNPRTSKTFLRNQVHRQPLPQNFSDKSLTKRPTKFCATNVCGNYGLHSSRIRFYFTHSAVFCELAAHSVVYQFSTWGRQGSSTTRGLLPRGLYWNVHTLHTELSPQGFCTDPCVSVALISNFTQNFMLTRCIILRSLTVQ
jgi:hypothetical protein